MTFWNKVNPKIQAAFLVSLAAMVVGLGNAFAEVYPQWGDIILLLAAPIAGWFKSAEPKEPA